MAQRVANAIKTITIYETKTRMARESMNQTKQQEEKIAEDISNKRKWEDDHKESSSQQQNKKPKAIRAYTARPSNKKGYAGNLPLCMVAPTILVSAEENLGDLIDIRVDNIHPEPVAVVNFLAAIVVRTQAQHGEAIRGIHEQLLGVPIQEELIALIFSLDIVETENASLHDRIKTTEAIEKITRNRERQTRIKIEQQLAAVQES
nr:hypothetical protein [Tanacetum cinerariifolium]